jgi:hypothetical protein
MATPSEILGQMIANVESQVDNLDSSIGPVQEQIDALNVEIDGVQNGLCEAAASDSTGLVAYLIDTKIPELEILYGGELPYSFDYGPTFGTINYTTGNITDWQILDSTGGVVYEYLGTNWDSDLYITQKISDYAFGNDYLTRPMTTGATYGLIPARDNLNTAKGILNSNKSKVEASETTFADYAS